MPAYDRESIIKVDKTSLAVSANTNIFATDLVPLSTSTPSTPTKFIIYIVPHSAGILSAFRTTSGTATTRKETFLPVGLTVATLGIDTEYEFSIRVGPNDTINLQYSVSDTLTKLMIIESP